MHLNKIRFIIIILVFFNISCVSLTKDNYYLDIIKEAKSGSVDFAFMKMRNYLKDNPDSKYVPEIKFSIIEYYFQINNYNEAISELSAYLNSYPQEQNSVFAYALLYKIILKYKKDSKASPGLLRRLEDLFFSKPLFLVFAESKSKQYRSALNNTYKIVNYLDKIEIFRNGELFFEISL